MTTPTTRRRQMENHTVAEASPPEHPAAPGRTDIDQISLDQALRDFEVANARVIDLTHRLTGMNTELINLRSEVEWLRLRLNDTQADRAVVQRRLTELQSSTAYRAARRLGDVRARLTR